MTRASSTSLQGSLQISSGSKDSIESSPLPDRLSVGVKSPSPAGADLPSAAAQSIGQAGLRVAARPAGSNAAGGLALEGTQAGLKAARQAAADAAGLAAGAAKAVRVGLAEAAIRALGTDQELPQPRSHQGQVKEKEVDKPVKTMRVHPKGPPVQPEPPEVWAQRKEQVGRLEHAQHQARILRFAGGLPGPDMGAGGHLVCPLGCP